MNRLSVFTRYPEAGKVKTRLIPALGAQKAMEIHRRLTELTLKTAAALKKKLRVEIEIAYHGGSRSLMESWLGEKLCFTRQAEGDLGRKIRTIIENNLNSGFEKNIVIGSDCPGLSAEILAEAFHKLDSRDLILGPAADGGYYAAGLKKIYPRLFENIAWGSDKVFEQTMSAAEKLKLAVWSPPKLNDIDRPEDLPFLENLNADAAPDFLKNKLL